MQVLSKLRLPAIPTAPVDVARLADLTTGAGINYSTVARNTGLRWIEWSPVWRIVYLADTGASTGTANTIGQIANFVGLVSVSGYCVAGDGWRYPVGYTAGANYLSVRVHVDGTVAELHNPAFLSDLRLILIVDFIASTADITTWDAGLTTWDSGLTTWDVI